MQTPDIQNILAELTRSIGETPTEILPIAASGSARKYYRIVTEKRTLIGTYSENKEENEAFLTFSKHFHDLGLNVPEVFAVNEDKTCYLQSDFGSRASPHSLRCWATCRLMRPVASSYWSAY